MAPNRPVPALLLLLLLVFLAPAAAPGQDLYRDVQREFADENQLQRDVRRYQHDVATGHYLRAAADRARIQNDESNIRYDQALVQNDLAYQAGYQGQALAPHPQYPGYYYYPSRPGQLYYYPASQPAPPQAAAPAAFAGPPAPPPAPASLIGPAALAGPASVAPANVPAALVASQNPNPVTFNLAPPVKTVTVLISNPAETGVPVNFAVDGTAYSVPSGYTQRLAGTAASVVEFDRGELFGDARYGLAEGPYEFRYAAEKGWDLYRIRPKPPAPSASALPRNVPPRGVASAAAAAAAGDAPAPAGGGPSAKEAVPPMPMPEPASPR